MDFIKKAPEIEKGITIQDQFGCPQILLQPDEILFQLVPGFMEEGAVELGWDLAEPGLVEFAQPEIVQPLFVDPVDVPVDEGFFLGVESSWTSPAAAAVPEPTQGASDMGIDKGPEAIFQLFITEILGPLPDGFH
jgi:hypothetical protein